MKKQIFLLTIILSLFIVKKLYAQNDLKARVEYEEAEKEYNDGHYFETLGHLREADVLLNKWTPKVSYLKIKTLDKLLIIDGYSSSLKEEIAKYMAYANTNQDKISMEQFKEVYEIEKKDKNFMEKKELQNVSEIQKTIDMSNKTIPTKKSVIIIRLPSDSTKR